MKKKAISPMVSYILLIVIVLSLAVGVFTWLRLTVPTGEQQTCPEDVALIVKNYDCNLNAQELTLTIENKGLFNVDGFFITASNVSGELPTIQLSRGDVTPSLVIPGRYDFQSAFNPNDVQDTIFDYENQSTISSVLIRPFVIEDSVLICENTINLDIEGCD